MLATTRTVQLPFAHHVGPWMIFAAIALAMSQALRLVASRAAASGRARLRRERVALGLAPMAPARRRDAEPMTRDDGAPG